MAGYMTRSTLVDKKKTDIKKEKELKTQLENGGMNPCYVITINTFMETFKKDIVW